MTNPRNLTGNASPVMNDGSVPMAGDLAMRGNRVTGLGAPVDPNDAARLADVGAGGGGGGWNYVLDTTGTGTQNPSKNVYTSFPDLYAALDALPQGVAPSIMFLGNFTFPTLDMPVTGWNMRLGRWQVPILATGSTIITVPDGVLIDSLSLIDEGCAVKVTPTTADGVFVWNYLHSLAPSAPSILAVNKGACLSNQGTKAAIAGSGTGEFIVFATQAATFGVIGADTAPFVKADAPDIVIAAFSFSTFYGTPPDGWLEGSAFLFRQAGVDTRDQSNPAWSGIVVAEAQSVLNPRAVRGARKTLIFTDNAITPTETDTFDDFEKLYAVYTALDGPIDIEFKGTPGSSIPIPPKSGGGAWVMKEGTRWTSAHGVAGAAQVRLTEGCVVQDLQYVGNGVTVVGDSSTPSLTFTPPTGGEATVLIFQGLGSQMANLNANPMIDWGYDSTDGVLIIGLSDAATITKGGGGGEIVNVQPTGAGPAIVAFYVLGGILDESTIRGSGSAVAGFVAGAGAQISLKQPNWSGGPLATSAFQSVTRARFNIQTAPLVAGGPTYVMGDVTAGLFMNTNGENGSEFVRYDASGGAVPVQVPDPRYCPGQSCLFKEVSGAPTGNLVLTSPFGNIDGDPGPGIVIPTTPYMFTRITSDGENWWIT